MATQCSIPTSAILPFTLLTFTTTWGVMGLYLFAPEQATNRFGTISGIHPPFVLATWGPGLAALAIVLGRLGMRGFRSFVRRLLLWRVGVGWSALVVLGLPLVFVAGSLIKGGPVLAPIPAGHVGSVFVAMVLALGLGPVEELGWRGFMQPVLQRLMAPLWAGLTIGTVWGVWHVPAFLAAGTLQSEWSFGPFFLGSIALAVIATPLLNASRGGLFWPVVFHWQLINPFWPDARPWDTWLLVAVAVLVTWQNRDMMLRGEGAATVVVPDPARAGRRNGPR